MPDRVRTAIYELSKNFPDEPRAELVVGKAYKAIGDWADAKVHFRRAVEKAQFDVDILYELANQQFEIKDLSGALWSLRKVGQASPGHLGAGVLRAAVLIQLNEFDKAGKLIRELRDEHGEKAEILTVEGDWHMARKQVDEAVGAYRRAHEAAGTARTVRTLFRAYVAAGRIDTAAELMETWIAGHSNDVGSRHLYAQMLIREKRWRKAKEIYEAMQAQGVEDIMLLNNLATTYQHLGDGRALPTAERAYEKAPELASVIDTYGWILTEHGQVEEGLALLRDAYARTSTSPAVRYHIGLALARLGRNQEAREEVEAALAEDVAFPGRDEARALLAGLRKKGGD
jgi:Tfp pilus assembly protein PilF